MKIISSSNQVQIVVQFNIQNKLFLHDLNLV